MKGQSESWVRTVTQGMLLCCCLLFLHQGEGRADRAFRQLVEASDERFVQGRISGGFPCGPPDRGGNERHAARLRAATLLLKATAGTTHHHKAGIALLALGRTDAAIDHFNAAAAITPHDATIWNDLAAARHQRAIRTNRPAELRWALAAITKAIRLDPYLLEARFNRALILEGLGLRSLAASGWEAYARADLEKGWSAEAKQHIRHLRHDVRPDVRKAIVVTGAAFQVGERSAVQRFVDAFPQEARTWGQGLILAEWAALQPSADEGAASQKLAFAEALGNAVARRNGDTSLSRSVSSIRASLARGRLASAQLEYATGRKHYGSGNLRQAESEFRRALKLLGNVSPMCDTVRYYLAGALFEQGRIDESREILLDILNRIDVRASAGLFAEVKWQVALADIAQARFGAAAVNLNQSSQTFDRLGEAMNAARTREIRAETLELTGETESAWLGRPAILARLSDHDDLLHSALAHLTIAAMAESEWDIADAFLILEAEQARRSNNRQLAAHAMVRRAVVDLRLGRTAAARHAIVDAYRACNTLYPDLRKRIEIDLGYAETLTSGASTPSRTTLTIGRSINFHRSEGRRMDVPVLLLERARSRRAAGDTQGEWSDIVEAVAELEVQRGNATREHAADLDDEIGRAVFGRAITMRLAARDPVGALAFAERLRAFELFGSPLPVSARRVAEILPESTALIEYVTAPSQLIIFAVERTAVHVFVAPVPASEITSQVRALREAIIDRAPRASTQQKARWLNDTLLRPIAPMLSRNARAVIIPDRALSGLPFSALYDARRRLYLAETHEIAIAPTAAAYVHARRRSISRGMDRLLFVANPLQRARPDLPAAASEALNSAKQYQSASTLSGRNATFAAFRSETAKASVIHFAGHADDVGTALVFAEDGDHTGIVDARDIATLKLTTTRVVILSACASALGTTSGRERTISVGRAFLNAGVPSVIGTLWDVPDDEAARVFAMLHAHLALRKSPTEALRTVQLSLARSTDVDVAVWSGLQSMGN